MSSDLSKVKLVATGKPGWYNAVNEDGTPVVITIPATAPKTPAPRVEFQITGFDRPVPRVARYNLEQLAQLDAVARAIEDGELP